MYYPIAISLINRLKNLKGPEQRRKGNSLIKKIVSKPRSIVVTRLQNIGDMVAFIPSLIKLRELYPEAKILLMGKHRAGIETIKGAPFVDEVLEVGRGTLREKLRLFRKLRKMNVDIFIVSSQDQGRIPWALFSGAKVLVGFREVVRYGKLVKEKLRFLISIPLEYNYGASEAENNLMLVNALGARLKHPKTTFDWYKKEDKKFIDRELAKNGISSRDLVVVICPGTKRPAKMWDYHRFSKIASELHDKYGAAIILCGSKADRKIGDQIREEAPFIIDLVSKTSISALGYLLSIANLVISVDSGPMHIAAAVGAPLIGLFGPGEFDKWRPYSNNPKLVSPLRYKTNCSPCPFYECPKDRHRCMEGISVNAVMSEAEKLLSMTGKITHRA